MPQLYITGVNVDGRSAVTEIHELSEASGMTEVFRLAQSDVTFPEGRDDVLLLDSPIAPGGSVYNAYVWEPGQSTPLHRTSTTDVDVVLQGSVVLELETESVTLTAGDVAILPGTAHRWISGPDGAVVLYNLVAGSASGADVSRRRAHFG